MDQKCIFKHIIGIIVLVLSNITETETKEYYCTRKGTWVTAISTCLTSGGAPVSYIDLANGTELKVKDGNAVWTADYLYLDYVKGDSKLNGYFDCGYVEFTRVYNRDLKEWTYTPTGEVNYDYCTQEKPYICESSSHLYVKQVGITWSQAYASCPSSYELWTGHKFDSKVNLTYTDGDHVELWVSSRRGQLEDTVSGTRITDRHVINCGTSERILKEEESYTCNQDLQAICKFERKIAEAKFLRSCLQDDKRTEPTTPVRVLTAKFMRTTTTSHTITAATETSNESTEISTKLFSSKKANMKAKLSPKTTELVKSKSTTVKATLLPLSTETFTKIFHSKTTSSMTEHSTQSRNTGTSADFVNSSGFHSMSDGLSNTTIIVIVTAAITVIIGCIVTVLLVLYFFRKRFRFKSERAKPGMVQFKNDQPSKAKVFRSRNDKTADSVCENNEAESKVYYEVVLDNIEPEYVNERVECRFEASVLVKQESSHVSDTPDAYYKVVQDMIEPVHVNGTEEDRYEALRPVKQEPVYVNKTPEDYYEKLNPDIIESA